ncbi:hypothetical protein F4778DRAFT_267883 [Xylariomycetidae sp. FL2044]|nr:hypothetical protein F4778DRAFT_267883 [Xylariomycetidae sp. FL2044]
MSENSSDRQSPSPQREEKPKRRRTMLPSAPPRKFRKLANGPKATRRRGRKRNNYRSCQSCRDAHLRCVAIRLGEPCERCVKKSLDRCCLINQSAVDVGPSTNNNKMTTTTAVHLHRDPATITEKEDPAEEVGRPEVEVGHHHHHHHQEADSEPEPEPEEESGIDPNSEQSLKLRQVAIAVDEWLTRNGM